MASLWQQRLQCTWNARKIGACRRRYKPRYTEQRGNRGLLADAEFDHQIAVRLKQPWRLPPNDAIAVEAIGAAIERAARIVPHLGSKRADVGARDIGRVAD